MNFSDDSSEGCVPSELNVENQHEASPRFSVTSVEEMSRAMEYLEENGYVVISNVVNPEELQEARELLWAFLESTNSKIKRDKIDTWRDLPCMPGTGVISGDGVGQSSFLWYCRTRPNVRKIFEHVWGTDSLLTSFDGAGVFRPWYGKYNEWKSRAGWFHVDQNPVTKPSRICVQGLLNLYDHGVNTGSLVLIPRSHHSFSRLKSYCKSGKTGDFIVIPKASELLTPPQLMVEAKAGDFILWDSRTIHSNAPALHEPVESDPPRLLRAVAYICMTPTSFMDKHSANRILKERQKAYLYGVTTNHWPHEFKQHIGNQEMPRNQVKPSKETIQLIRGLPPDQSNDSDQETLGFSSLPSISEN